MADVEADQQPLISVVTVCFNAAGVIGQALQSVHEQRGVSFEHIVIDGGSTDGTLDAVEGYRDRLAAFVSEPDRGVYDAMHKGLMLARGKFTGFLNADDYFSDEQALAKLTAPLKADEYGGLTGVVEQIDASERTVRVIGRKPFRPWHLSWGKFPPHPATYLKTDLMKEVGGFDTSYRLLGDMDMFIRVTDRFKPAIAHVPETIVRMRIGGMSTAGLGAYRANGAEMAKALRKSGRRVNLLTLNSRLLVKAPEFLRALVGVARP